MSYLNDQKKAIPPQVNEIEISIFGRGVGECLVLHVGNNEWVIVDSHYHPDTKEPIALWYLKSLGVDPATAVKAIIITHWDKDHISGMPETITECKNADICLPSAFIEDDFNEFMHAYANDDSNDDFSSNTILDSLTIALTQRRHRWATQDRLLHGFSNGAKVYSLSPADSEYTEFLAFIGSQIPQDGDPQLKVVDRKRNFISTALLVETPAGNILLGADMMKTTSRGRGWAAILDSSQVIGTLKEKAVIYKAAHHGAESGDFEEVWQKLLEDKPVTLIAPYAAGREPLPTKRDILRFESRTDKAFITSSPF